MSEEGVPCGSAGKESACCASEEGASPLLCPWAQQAQYTALFLISVCLVFSAPLVLNLAFFPHRQVKATQLLLLAYPSFCLSFKSYF